MDILQPYIDNAEGIVLKAENGKYLSVISRPGRQPIEARKNEKDNYCIFHITKIDDSTIALQSKSWNNKYLSRIWRHGGKLLLIILGLRILKISYWTSTKNLSPKISIFWDLEFL